MNDQQEGIVLYLNGYPAIDVASSSRDDLVYLSRFMDKAISSLTPSPRVPDIKPKVLKNSEEQQEKTEDNAEEKEEKLPESLSSTRAG